MSRQVDKSDLSAVSNEELEYLHDRYQISEKEWLKELENRGLTSVNRGLESQQEAQEEEAAEPTIKSEPNYEVMTKNDLVNLAKGRGFDVQTRATKEEIIEALKADDGGSKDEESEEEPAEA